MNRVLIENGDTFSCNSFEFNSVLCERFRARLKKPDVGQMGGVHPLDTNLTLSPTQAYYSFPHCVVPDPVSTDLQFNRFKPNVSPHQSQGIETIN